MKIDHDRRCTAHTLTLSLIKECSSTLHIIHSIFFLMVSSNLVLRRRLKKKDFGHLVLGVHTKYHSCACNCCRPFAHIGQITAIFCCCCTKLTFILLNHENINKQFLTFLTFFLKKITAKRIFLLLL